MRIKKISITKLFNIFNHVIELNNEDKITIIHGPNGYGKTIILQMIHGLFNGNFSIFRKIPFSTFRIDFTDNNILYITKNYKQIKGSVENFEIRISKSPNTKRNSFLVPHIETERYEIEMARRFINNSDEFERIGSNEWINSSGERFTLDDVIDNNPQLIQFEIPNWFIDIKNSVNTRIIQTDRLQIRSNLLNISNIRSKKTTNMALAIIQYSKELATLIQQILAKSVELSSSLDRSFPSRLMSKINNQNPSKELTDQELRQELNELEEKREKLMIAGLLDRDDVKIDIPDKSIDNLILKNVLSIYIDDAKKKLEIFDDILNKIDLFQDIINQRFVNKKIIVDRHDGFKLSYISSEKSSSNEYKIPYGDYISLESLSSGEQHEIILFYELLFKVRSNSLVLIDEPEISLHIAWQKEFLSDISNIVKASNFDVIIATHSPDIINDRWDLTVALGEPDEE